MEIHGEIECLIETLLEEGRYRQLDAVLEILWYTLISRNLAEEHKLRVFEYRVLRRIFGPKRDGVTGGWRKLHKRSFILCTIRQI
jgi:hypothetical protein